MKEFLKQIPKQMAITYTIMMIVFLFISILLQKTTITISILIQLFVISLLISFLQILAFTDILLKKARYPIRLFIFMSILLLINITFVIIFNWFSMKLSSWLLFFGIYIFCYILSTILFEIDARKTGEKYDGFLNQYKNK